MAGFFSSRTCRAPELADGFCPRTFHISRVWSITGAGSPRVGVARNYKHNILRCNGRGGKNVIVGLSE